MGRLVTERCIMSKFDVAAWVKLFEDVGLTDEMMKRWHALFEERWPADHQRFLEWLGLSAAEIVRVRSERP